ncbi:hypothetical protein [Streptacidiphilus fuscans]|uniref:Uncharacterized protein n=1 Tax=Streptacidiphilus fuscans TaxID=2789292 RepID=A0A931B3F5_9ACTN|nr:hypothetical protein [Streptacidiphilus fuscans]MBF9069536.1 hypothetical protein [Streptacidiphilus fuscans]
MALLLTIGVTLDLFQSWYPGPAGTLMRSASLCLLDAPLREAFGYGAPPAALSVVVRGSLRLRGRVVRRLPPRREPFHARQNSNVRGYPNGYRVAELGTFPGGGCPVAGGAAGAAPATD